jgi:hypothetical protein
MSYEQKQISALLKKEKKLRHHKQVAQMDLLVKEFHKNLSWLKKKFYAPISNLDTYLTTGRYQTEEEIEEAFRQRIEFEIDSLEYEFRELEMGQLLIVPGEANDAHIQELTAQINELVEQMDEIKYNFHQSFLDQGRMEKSFGVFEEYDDYKIVNKRVVF